MEVNSLTYLIYKFLATNGWKVKKINNSKFIFLITNNVKELPENFELKLPISNKSKDFYSYCKNVLELISSLYPQKVKNVERLNELNEKLKNRYTKQWIMPENKSKIEKINKFDIYLPR